MKQNPRKTAQKNAPKSSSRRQAAAPTTRRLVVLKRTTMLESDGYNVAGRERIIATRWIVSGSPATMLREAATLAPEHQPMQFVVSHQKQDARYLVWIQFYLRKKDEPSRTAYIDLSADEARRFIRYAAEKRRADHIIAITPWEGGGR